MRMGDIVEIDGNGYLRVIGRTSDIIIRGGKNISAPALEAEIAEHPDVLLAAAVSMPDETLGERVCVYVTTRGHVPITLDDVVAFLGARGVASAAQNALNTVWGVPIFRRPGFPSRLSHPAQC